MLTVAEFCRLRDEHAVMHYAESLAKARARLAEAEAARKAMLNRWRAEYRELQLPTVSDDAVWVNKLNKYLLYLKVLPYPSTKYSETKAKLEADVRLAGAVMVARSEVQRLEKLYRQALIKTVKKVMPEAIRWALTTNKRRWVNCFSANASSCRAQRSMSTRRWPTR